MTLVIDAVALLALDGGVDDGDKAYPAILHLLDKAAEVREALPADREVLEAVHIVDVQIYHIQRDTRLAVPVGDREDVVAAGVAPAALTEAERPQRRRIAASDQGAELPHNVLKADGLDDIQLKVQLLGLDAQQVGIAEADVEADPARTVEERAEAPLAVNDEEAVRPVESALVLGVEWVVTAEALIDPPALVDASDALAQPVHAVRRAHPIGENAVGQAEI